MRRHSSILFALIALASVLASPTLATAQPGPVPIIERIEPTSGPVGTQIQIIGRRLHPHSAVLLGQTQLVIEQRMPTRWIVRVPDGARSGHIVFRTRWGESLGPEFRVTQAAPGPAIDSFEPMSGSIGTQVTIRGRNFSPRLTGNTVLLSARPCLVRVATTTTLIVSIPTRAQTAPFIVRVVQAGEAQSAQPFTVSAAAIIGDFQPRIGPPGTRVTLTGQGFSATPSQNRVFIQGVPVRVESATATQIVVSIPRNATTAPIVVDVQGNGRAETSAPFRVQYPPTITRVDPVAAPVGRLVTIRGTGFGDDPRVVDVRLAGRPARIRGITPTTLAVEVPQGATTGQFAVNVAGLGPAMSPQFIVLAPLAITSFAPQSGAVGAEVTIRGTGFSEVITANRVRLSGVRAQVLAATATELRVRVPQAHSGPFEVAVALNGRALSTAPFTVTMPPILSDFAPRRGAPGAEVTIRGRNFGTNAQLVEVKIGGRVASVRAIGDDRLIVVVPANAQTGVIEVTVRLQGTAATSVPFEVITLLAVRLIAPSTGRPGTPITVRGEGFVDGTRVGFRAERGWHCVAAQFVNAHELRVTVPDLRGLQTGPITVCHPDGRVARSEMLFTVTALPTGLQVTTIEASCTRPGCTIVIRGRGFSPLANRNRVFFASRPVRVRMSTSDSLTISLPRAVGTSPFRIDVQNTGVVDSPPFTITAQ